MSFSSEKEVERSDNYEPSPIVGAIKVNLRRNEREELFKETKLVTEPAEKNADQKSDKREFSNQT